MKRTLQHRIPARYLTALPLTLLLTVFCPASSWALQSHGPPEGLYVHQMAHVLFISGLGYLFWDIRRNQFTSRGWHYLQIFCVCMLVWNIVALSGHWVEISLQDADLNRTGGYLSTRFEPPLTPLKLLFFILKLDHLVIVPALCFFLLSLRTFYRASLEEGER